MFCVLVFVCWSYLFKQYILLFFILSVYFQIMIMDVLLVSFASLLWLIKSKDRYEFNPNQLYETKIIYK